MQPLIDIFDVKDLIPQGYCLSWSPVLLWLHVIPDLLITLSYHPFLFMLVYFIPQRKGFSYLWPAVLFAGFITAWGTVHYLLKDFRTISIKSTQYWRYRLFPMLFFIQRRTNTSPDSAKKNCGESLT